MKKALRKYGIAKKEQIFMLLGFKRDFRMLKCKKKKMYLKG